MWYLIVSIPDLCTLTYIFLIKINILKKILHEHYHSVNGLCPDLNIRSVSSELGPNYLQMLSADKEGVGN